MFKKLNKKGFWNLPPVVLIIFMTTLFVAIVFAMYFYRHGIMIIA